MAERGPKVRRGRRALMLVRLLVSALLVTGCSSLTGASPAPTALDFPGLAGQLALQGLTVARPVSGDAGCNDATLIPTAIGFDLSGLGVTTPLRARVFIFSGPAAYERRRADVDTCTAAWASDPASVEFVDASPLVLVVQGPIPPAFKAALVRAVTTASGSGG